MTLSSRAILAFTFCATVAVAFIRPAPENTCDDQAILHEAMEGYDDFVLRQIVRERISRDTAEGRRSLFEAAELFRQINEIPPCAFPSIHFTTGIPRLQITGDSAESRLCCQVIVHTYWTLQRDGLDQVADTVAARLDGEFHEEILRHGEIRLPDPNTLESVSELFEKERRRWRAP